MKIDFHTHILPDIDDGAMNIDVSLAMLSRLSEQHVDTVVLSSHFYSHREPMSEFIERREYAFEHLREVNPHKDITLRLGAEVFFSDYLFNYKDLSELCIDRTRTLLLELPFNIPVDMHMVDKLYQLITEYDVVPVLAHIERYPALIRSSSKIRALEDIGCYFQLNLASFTAFGKRRLLSLVKNGHVSAIGTDAHNLSSRAPEYDEGYQVLTNALPYEQVEQLQKSMNQLLYPR